MRSHETKSSIFNEPGISVSIVRDVDQNAHQTTPNGNVSDANLSAMAGLPMKERSPR
ncbi:hypothetical protein AGR4C_Lc100007 [Agrobacterium tumefaciens str. Kerr 14]|uniref:Uncharacterized protein n=1 Tax=Agrobacterium tumefaciens str. Kerr 14 TaxID=1183424 RepID=A0A1S7R1S7_AGRTU|nr:hypothetical protein AGR4C_Lc100007 [Agrobacterium tumefaciens str. Kerr 14]